MTSVHARIAFRGANSSWEAKLMSRLNGTILIHEVCIEPYGVQCTCPTLWMTPASPCRTGINYQRIGNLGALLADPTALFPSADRHGMDAALDARDGSLTDGE
jgi:hypothetical protein